jgi:hypothetical protein
MMVPTPVTELHTERDTTMAPNTTPKPDEIARTLAGYATADLSTTCAIFAGILQSVRLTGPDDQIPAGMAGAKAGADKLRVETDKWGKRFRKVNGTGQAADDPIAKLVAAGQAALAQPAE